MTRDDAVHEVIAREGSEPLDQVLGRALKGESITCGMGPFFIVLNWPGRVWILPVPFDSVEDALLQLTLMLHDHPHAIAPGGWVTICFRLGSMWVQ